MFVAKAEGQVDSRYKIKPFVRVSTHILCVPVTHQHAHHSHRFTESVQFAQSSCTSKLVECLRNHVPAHHQQPSTERGVAL